MDSDSKKDVIRVLLARLMQLSHAILKTWIRMRFRNMKL